MQLNDHSSLPLPRLSVRQIAAHKGDFGRVLAVAGSRDMTGAAAIVGLSALRSGAGLVTVATPRSVQHVVATYSPCYTLQGLAEGNDGTLAQSCLAELLSQGLRFDAWAIGPGLGRAPETACVVVELVRQIARPMVVDADALNALAEQIEKCPQLLDAPPSVRVLTPHGGEFARLTGQTPAESPEVRATQAAALCRLDSTQQTLVVLKGHQTIICDGRRYAVNATGNPGMATGGCGDCLTGVIAALLGQGLSGWDAARLGVHVHGLAGDLAADALGQTALIATDLVDYLPQAWSQ